MITEELPVIALVVAVLTAAGGLYMAGILLRTGRPEAEATGSHLSSRMVAAHAGLAGVGIILLGVFLGYGGQGVAWAALAFFVLAALGGGAMFLIWTKDRHGDRATVEENKRRLAEQQIPSAAVHGHGALAAIVLVCMLVIALTA